MNEPIKYPVWSLEKIRNVWGVIALVGGIAVPILHLAFKSDFVVPILMILMFWIQLISIRSFRLSLLLLGIFVVASFSINYLYCMFGAASCQDKIPLMTIFAVAIYLFLSIIVGLCGFLGFVPQALRQKSIYNKIRNRIK